MNFRAHASAAIFASLCWLSSCSTTVLLPWPPTTIGEEWSDFKFGAQVSPELKFQRLELELDEPRARPKLVIPAVEPNRPVLLLFPDGHSVSVFAETIMVGGGVRPLAGNGYVEYAGGFSIYFTGRLTRRDSITGIRLRASTPVRIKRAYWIEYDTT